MDFREVVAQRRMVRSYTPEPVDGDTLIRILDTARRAPSAGFSQGQRFVVVTEAATRRAIAESAGEPAFVADGFPPWISQAPVHVVVCADEDAYRARYREPDKAADAARWPIPYWYVDAGCSLMLLLLATVDEGLAAGFLGAHRLDGLSELIGLPQGVHPLGVVTVGHPAPDRRSGSLQRGWRELDDVVAWERWGGRRPAAGSCSWQ